MNTVKYMDTLRLIFINKNRTCRGKNIINFLLTFFTSFTNFYVKAYSFLKFPLICMAKEPLNHWSIKSLTVCLSQILKFDIALPILINFCFIAKSNFYWFSEVFGRLSYNLKVSIWQVILWENLKTNCGMNTFKNQLHISVPSPQGTMMLGGNVDTDGGIRVNRILPGTSGLQVQVN